MREFKKILNFVESRSSEKLVLVTLLKTEGATYRKAGALKIVSDDGASCGLISGGCLENEIIAKCLKLKTDEETFELNTFPDQDRLFGSNLGCQGKMVIRVEKKMASEILQDLKANNAINQSLKINIIGLGPDTIPLQELLLWTGWDFSFFSTQKDRVLEKRQLGWPVEYFRKIPIEFKLQRSEQTAFILMSHNYPTDLEVFFQLSKMNPEFIGLLGPESRRQQLISDLEKIHQVKLSESFLKRVHGPVGESDMGRGESAIALSIVTQLQKHFFGESSV